MAYHPGASGPHCTPADRGGRARVSVTLTTDDESVAGLTDAMAELMQAAEDVETQLMAAQVAALREQARHG